MLSVSSRNISNGAYKTLPNVLHTIKQLEACYRERVVVSKPENLFQVSFDFRFMQILA